MVEVWRSSAQLGPNRYPLSRAQDENVGQQGDDRGRGENVLEVVGHQVQKVESPDDDHRIEGREDDVEDDEDADITGCHITTHRAPG